MDERILYLGMNPGAAHEIAALKRKGHQVVALMNAHNSFTRGAREFDLNNYDGVLQALRALKLSSPHQLGELLRIIDESDADARDELLQLVEVWSAAEGGARVPRRMILSGHHIGEGIFGDDNGQIDWTTFTELAAAMPRAAAQIEHLHVAGCYTGGAKSRLLYRTIFPNLKSVWAYGDSAPGAVSGATVHLHAWAKATGKSGAGVVAAAKQLRQRRVRKSAEIYAKRTTGPLPKPADFQPLWAKHRGSERVFEQFFSGQREARGSNDPELRDYYGTVQALLQSPFLSEDEEWQLENKRNVVIRLLYYKRIRARFAAEYARYLRAGYRDAGRPLPDYSRLPRRQALAEIAAFVAGCENEFAVTPMIRSTAWYLLGLRHLGEVPLEALVWWNGYDADEVIPDAWV